MTIVGVTAPGFSRPRAWPGSRLVLPLALKTLDDPGFLTAHDNLTSMPLVARLETGVTEAQARAAVESVLQQYLPSRRISGGSSGTTSLKPRRFFRRAGALTSCVRTTPLRSGS